MTGGCAALILAATASLTSQVIPWEAHEELRRTRAFIQYERWEDAICVADAMIARYPQASIARQAHFLRHKAQLFKALDLTRADPPITSAAPLIQSLRGIAREPMDDAVAAAKLALATVYYRTATGGRPATLVEEAMAAWKATDAQRTADSYRLPLARDVIAIRNVVFEPFGGGVYANDPRWSGVTWSRRGAPIVFVNPVIRVFADADLPSLRLATYESFPAHPNVVFLDADRRQLLDRIITTIGWARPQPWMGPGASRDVLAFWADAGLITRGRAGGWTYDAFPRITSLEFLDPQRTIARVSITTGYAGAAIWLEKKNGVWMATSVRDFWVS